MPTFTARRACHASASTSPWLIAMILRLSAAIGYSWLPGRSQVIWYVVQGRASTMVLDPPGLVFLYGSREVLWTGIAPALLAERGSIRDALIRCEQVVRTRLG